MIYQGHINALPFADNSIDMIFTDPPYLKEYLPCYEWLAREAMRVLKPGGFVLAMCGQIYLPQIYAYFEAAQLTYYWTYQNKMGGSKTGQVWPHGFKVPVIVRNKPILAYSKGKSAPRTVTYETYKGQGVEKDYHIWGQDVDSARYYIDCFSREGDLVLDPFVGGGTSAIACERIGRRFVGGDIDPAAIASTLEHMSQPVQMNQGALWEVS